MVYIGIQWDREPYECGEMEKRRRGAPSMSYPSAASSSREHHWINRVRSNTALSMRPPKA
jgi:hypothetical protein